MALPIEDYALIGDRHTAALVGKNGSVDWLCLPRFDSPACLAGLLGTDEHGHWQLCPTDDHTATRRYVDDTTILETTFETAGGTLTLTDLMPTGVERADVVRVLRCTRGTVRVRHRWRIRFDYGAVRPWVRREKVSGNEVLTAVGGPDQIVLRGPRLPTEQDDGGYLDEFELSEGDAAAFDLVWLPSHAPPPEFDDVDQRIDDTVRGDQEWANLCPEDLPHADVVRRSLLTLRLMTHEVTGGIVAAPTTSLPEDFGGVRNWDYRFCWLRDAALTLTSLVAAGQTAEAGLWRDWLLRAVAGDPRKLQIMYGVDGTRRLTEHELDHLPGYADSRPVRIGNGAYGQHQLDVIGETLDALAVMRDSELGSSADAWAIQRQLLEDLAERWRQPDHGIWEIRGAPQYFTHSRAMVWVAFDRGVRAIEEYDLDGPLDRWASLRDAVREEVLTRGFDEERNTFTQHYATTEVDAALLVLPIVGLIPGDDPRMLGTIEAIERDLLRDGLPLRYRTESGVDGLSGEEHPFLACGFWLVSAYALAGRLDDAHRLFDRLVGLVNDVGLLSEEYDPAERRMVGNFPQAFSHLTLVEAALHLREADRARTG
ncbi:glycoside hydrolase family 15 protein [Nocardioides sp. SYSU DS0651]|uniref:glycoside hydrolase family 15 protein n=1 Tax=Nocardioides sp. SYSU DS0651 TaxID=3415955 RepID=UPI003F4C2A58